MLNYNKRNTNKKDNDMYCLCNTYNVIREWKNGSIVTSNTNFKDKLYYDIRY